MSDTLEISVAQPDQKTPRLIWDHACKSDGHCIGWLPFAAYDDACESGRVLTLQRNDEQVGFALWSVSRELELRILQIWVRPDARMIENGRALVEAMIETAVARRCWRLRLWCAEDLAANIFWELLGFQRLVWRHGRTHGGRRHWLWAQEINKPSITAVARRINSPSTSLGGSRGMTPRPCSSATRTITSAEV